MGKFNSVLIFVCFFVMLIIFTGAVSAANWTVNPGDSIQSVIDNASANDTILVNDNNGSAYTYTGNLVVNKTLQLKSKTGGKVNIKALNPLKPTIIIDSDGSTIQGLSITGSTRSSGIHINANDCNVTHNILSGNNHGIFISGDSKGNIIQNNTIQNDCNGIFLFGSNYNKIQDNNINNNYFGVYLSSGSNNNIIQNSTITTNQYGIIITNSNNNTIGYNSITANYYGILLSGSANINLNRITGNRFYGLYYWGNGVINVTNNWWGSNANPLTIPNNICVLSWKLIYNPWLVLNLTAIPTVTNGNSTITVDLTHNNQGNDTSSQGHIPDNTPLKFSTNIGAVTGTVYTRSGRANATFNCGTTTSGTATITTRLDKQNLQTYVIIDTTTPTVTAGLAGGVYNTTKSVTLAAADNFDSNPVIYYSTDNGTTWYSQTDSVSFNLTEGITNLMFYAVDAAGNTAPIQTVSYTIDTIAPLVTVNQVGGLYNTTQNVILTTIDPGSNATTYYTIDSSDPQVNGTVYSNPISISTTTTLRYIAVDLAGNWSPDYSQNYTIDTVPPTVTVNITGGVYNVTQTVTLTASDNLDSNPVIYYTTDGSTPTTSSTVYTAPIVLQMNDTKRTVTDLKFMAVDMVGNQAQVQNETYILTLPVVDINTNNCYSTIQAAINDPLTLNSHIIEIYSGTYVENVVLTKDLILKSVAGENVTVQAADYSQPVITLTTLSNGSTIQGINITGGLYGIYLESVDNCT